MINLCKCGCEQNVTKITNKYIHGHNRQGVKYSKELILKIVSKCKENNSYQHSLGTSPWRSLVKLFSQLGKSGVLLVVHIFGKLSTKLSTRFSTRLAESYATIHRLYYYNYFNYYILLVA